MAIYYDIKDDLAMYPNAWCLMVYSKRGGGKTYSTLRYMYEHKKIFVFMKRTIDDVKNLCKGSGRIGTVDKDYGVDLSPFKPLNRDFGWSVKCYEIGEGLAGFWNTETDENGKVSPVGSPIGFVLSATAVQKFKGYDLSECDYMIYDEFIPRPWERVNRKEGDQVLDMYETIARDRVKRGKDELKLICLANATEIANPFFITLDVVDIASNMNINNIEYNYDEYRGIMLHQLPADFDQDADTHKTGIQKAMEHTQWGIMAYGGKFGYNDFSAVGHERMKGYRPVCAIKHQQKYFYIYYKEGRYYMNRAKHNGILYDFAKENDQKRFYIDYGIDLRNACINELMTFNSYTMYDVIVNFKKYYKV